MHPENNITNQNRIAAQPGFSDLGRPIDRQWVDAFRGSVRSLARGSDLKVKFFNYPGIPYLLKRDLRRESKQAGVIAGATTNEEALGEIYSKGILDKELATNALTVRLLNLRIRPKQNDRAVISVHVDEYQTPDYEGSVILDEKRALKETFGYAASGQSYSRFNIPLGLIRTGQELVDDSFLADVCFQAGSRIKLGPVGKIEAPIDRP